MDFWNDDNSTTACDICGKDDGANVGQGSYNQVTKLWSFYLCQDCAAVENKRRAKEGDEERKRQSMAIAMSMTMD